MPCVAKLLGRCYLFLRKFTKLYGFAACVEFCDPWCRPCEFIGAPVVKELARKLPHVIFLKVDPKSPSVFGDWQEIAFPTCILLKEGVVVDGSGF